MSEILDVEQEQAKANFKFPEEPKRDTRIDPVTAQEYSEGNKNSPDFNPEEFKFHQRRFERQAEEHDNRGIFKRVLDRNEKKDASAFAYDEALRDNAEWNKLYHMELQENGELRKEMNAEFKEWHKMLEVVLENLKKKRDDPEGEGKEIRPLLLALGGGMAGSYGAGQVCALAHSGYLETFDTAVGISAGACDIAYFLAGKEQVLKGTSMYYEECANKEFLNFLRVARIMDVGYLSGVMKNDKDKKLDVDAIQENPTEFYIQASKVVKGERAEAEPELIDAKHNDKGIVESVRASMALAVFYGDRVKINGQDYVDGAMSEPFPIEEVIRKFKPTDVLVLPQMPFETMVAVNAQARFWNKIAAVIPRKGSLDIGTMALMEKFITSKEGFRKGLEHIQKQTGTRIGIMYPPDGGLVPITNDPNIVKAGILASAKRACEELGEKMNFQLK